MTDILGFQPRRTTEPPKNSVIRWLREATPLPHRGSDKPFAGSTSPHSTQKPHLAPSSLNLSTESCRKSQGPEPSPLSIPPTLFAASRACTVEIGQFSQKWSCQAFPLRPWQPCSPLASFLWLALYPLVSIHTDYQPLSRGPQLIEPGSGPCR